MYAYVHIILVISITDRFCSFVSLVVKVRLFLSEILHCRWHAVMCSVHLLICRLVNSVGAVGCAALQA